MASKHMNLFKYKYLKRPLVSHCNRIIQDYLFNYFGGIGAALILGGCDSINGVKLYSISPSGNSQELNYATMGSGSLAASGVLESKYRPDLSLEETIELGKKAIRAGILNDLYSGSNVNIFVIDQKFNKELQHIEIVEKKKNQEKIVYPLKSLKVTKEEVFKYIKEV